MTARFLAALLLLAPLALSCEDPVDPLEARRLAVLNGRWSESSRGPHLRLWMSGEAVGALLVRVLPRRPTVSGGGVQAQLRMDRPEVGFVRSRACEGCTGATVDWSGGMDVRLAGQPVVDGLRWTARVRGTLRFDVRDGEDDAQRVWLARVDTPTVDLEVEALPAVARPLLLPMEALLASGLTDALDRLGPLARVPAPIRVSALRVRGDGDVARIDVAFAGLGDPVGEPTAIRPKRGWAAAVPASTVKALAEQITLVDAPSRYQLDVRDLNVAEGAFALGVRVWRTGRREAWQDFVLSGVPTVDEERVLTVTELSVVPVARRGWTGRIATPFVRKKVLKRLAGAAATDRESVVEVPLPAGKALLQVDGIGLDEGMVRIRGSIAPG